MNTLAINRSAAPLSSKARLEHSIIRLAGSRIPGGLKRLLLLGAFFVGTLAGVWGANLRTDAGTDHQARTSFSTASNATGNYAALNYIALTENSDAPAGGDVTLVGELNAAGGGLNRAQATYAHTDGTNTVVLDKTFTINANDGSPKTPAKAGLLNAAAAGTLGYTTLIDNPPPLVFASGTGDSMAATWTFTL